VRTLCERAAYRLEHRLDARWEVRHAGAA
jgi:hypothetical protein